MNYFSLSRIVYSIPFLLYVIANKENFLYTREIWPYLGGWGVIFAFSLFFFGISRNVLPWPIVHFVFFSETFIYSVLAASLGMWNMLLLVIVSSFYAIESLRNSGMNILIHLVSLFVCIYFIGDVYGVSIHNIGLTPETLALLSAPIFCRAFVSAAEERDVVVEKEIENIYVPVEDPDKDNILKKLNFFKARAVSLKQDVKKAQQEKEALQRQFELVRNENTEKHRVNKEIAKSYFLLLANIRFDLSKGVDENINQILQVFMTVTKSQYVALITKEPPEKENESYSLGLSNSYKMIDIDDESFLQTPSVWEGIITSIEKDQSGFLVADESLAPIRNIIFTPVSYHPDVKGILVQGFNKEYNENIHNFNLSLMVAYHIYSVLKNEHLYKQAKDNANLDGLTGLFNKKYLLDNLQIIFNNATSYAENLACVFVDADWFKQVNDTYGHDEGDRVLKLIAQGLKKNTRKSDFVFRYGGDEFVILLNNGTEEKIKNISEELNNFLKDNNCKAKVNGEERFVTVSMGAKIYNPMMNNVKDGLELLKYADETLYQAKRNGKGNVYIM